MSARHSREGPMTRAPMTGCRATHAFVAQMAERRSEAPWMLVRFQTEARSNPSDQWTAFRE